jgi:hypothetical protein
MRQILLRGCFIRRSDRLALRVAQKLPSFLSFFYRVDELNLRIIYCPPTLLFLLLMIAHHGVDDQIINLTLVTDFNVKVLLLRQW